MPAVTGDAASSASVLVTRCWQAIDLLLPALGASPGFSWPGYRDRLVRRLLAVAGLVVQACLAGTAGDGLSGAGHNVHYC
jgi:hypothetical protein